MVPQTDEAMLKKAAPQTAALEVEHRSESIATVSSKGLLSTSELNQLNRMKGAGGRQIWPATAEESLPMLGKIKGARKPLRIF